MTTEKNHSHADKKIISYRSTIKRLMKDLGVQDIDDKMIESIEKTALMLNDMKGQDQTIAIRAGSVLLFIGIKNYNEIQRKIIKGLHTGYITQEDPVININIELFCYSKSLPPNVQSNLYNMFVQWFS